MGVILVPLAGGAVDSRAPSVEREIQRIDPRLELRVGVVEGRRSGHTHHTGRRWEVWGADRLGRAYRVGAWPLDALLRIPLDLRVADTHAPNHAPVLDRIDKHNGALERASRQQYVETMAELKTHMAFAAVRDSRSPFYREAPITRFSMAGARLKG